MGARAFKDSFFNPNDSGYFKKSPRRRFRIQKQQQKKCPKSNREYNISKKKKLINPYFFEKVFHQHELHEADDINRLLQPAKRSAEKKNKQSKFLIQMATELTTITKNYPKKNTRSKEETFINICDDFNYLKKDFDLDTFSEITMEVIVYVILIADNLFFQP